jgi:signal peptidase I
MSDARLPAHDARCELVVEVVRRFGTARVRVTGSSMLPAIRPGDTVWFRRCDADAARVGDVILFVRDGRLFAHRVTRRVGHCLVTQGDGLPAPDGPVSPGEVVGRASRILRQGRVFRPGARASPIARWAARALYRCDRLGRRLARLHSPARGVRR